jgi:hypothetical protein
METIRGRGILGGIALHDGAHHPARLNRLLDQSH